MPLIHKFSSTYRDENAVGKILKKKNYVQKKCSGDFCQTKLEEIVTIKGNYS